MATNDGKITGNYGGTSSAPADTSDQELQLLLDSITDPVQKAIVMTLLNNTTASTDADPMITLPTWVYGGGKTQEVYSTLVNYPATLLAQNTTESLKKFNKISTFLYGVAGKDVTEVSDAWARALSLAGKTGQGLGKIVNNTAFKAVIQGTAIASGPHNNYVLTNKQDANVTIGQVMQQYLDRLPTKAEQAQFYKQLNAAQMKNPTVSNTVGSNTYTTSGGVTAQEFALKYVLKKISKNNPELDGNLGTIQDTIKSYAVSNGLTISNADLVKAVKESVTSGDVNGYLNNYKAKMNERAAKKYTALADAHAENPNATIYDLSTEYISEMARMLEIEPNQISVKDIEPAISAVGQDGKQRTLATWEWRKQLRNDARYQYTGQAKQEATGMAQSFARAFGVNI